MKKFISLITLVALTYTAFAQNVDMRRKIEITGTAEQEVTPDIINVSISLQEYMDGKKKITIDQLEQQLFLYLYPFRLCGHRTIGIARTPCGFNRKLVAFR